MDASTPHDGGTASVPFSPAVLEAWSGRGALPSRRRSDVCGLGEEGEGFALGSSVLCESGPTRHVLHTTTAPRPRLATRCLADTRRNKGRSRLHLLRPVSVSVSVPVLAASITQHAIRPTPLVRRAKHFLAPATSPRRAMSTTHLVKLRLDLLPVLQELQPAVIERPMKDRQELECLGGEDFLAPLGRGGGEVDTGGEGHGDGDGYGGECGWVLWE